jgi:hypothetical protein
MVNGVVSAEMPEFGDIKTKKRSAMVSIVYFPMTLHDF